MKFSQVSINSAPADADYVMGVTAAGVDSRFSFATVLAYLKAKTAWVTSSNVDFTAAMLTQANAGSAGGTMHYMNLGGLKILWGTTTSLTSSNGTNYIVTFPVGFFTATPHYASANVQSMTGTADQTAGINANNALSTTNASITVANGANTPIAGQQYSFLFIGV